MSKPVFISYSTDDTASAASIRDGLEAAGIACWIAPRDIAPGEDYGAQIIGAIEACAVMVLVLSETSNQSQYVRNEVERAMAKRKKVIPVRIHNVTPSRSLEFFVSNAQWIDAWQTPLEAMTVALVAAVDKHIVKVAPPSAAAPATTSGTAPQAASATAAETAVTEAAATEAIVGRLKERAELAALLMSAGTRLVTLLGPGGIGKSTLAAAVAANLREHFADGVFEVALAALSHGEQIYAAVADAMRLKTISERPLPPQLFAHLAGKQTLIVLDNVEQLVDGAVHIKAVLDGAPAARILTTSRERLNLRDEVLFRLEGLPVPAGDADASNESIALFLRYAQRADPSLLLDDRAYAEIANICRLVSGMPLAIVLAASSTDALSVREIGAEIGRSLDVLESEMHDLPARQRSMRGVLDSTWARLSVPEQQAFARLSLFRGGFTREAALAVTGATVRNLVSLHGKSLIENDDGRYSIHELLRQFAAARLADSESAKTAQVAFAAHFLVWLKTREPALLAKETLVIESVDLDFENVRLAWTIATALGQTELLAGCLDAFTRFCILRGRMRDARDLLTFGIDQAGDESLKARLFENRALAHEVLGEFAREIEDAGIALRHARERGDDRKVIWLLNRQGNGNRRLGRLSEGQAALEEALAIAERIHDSHSEADTLYHLGMIFVSTKNLSKAMAMMEHANVIAEREKYKDIVAIQAAYGMAEMALLLQSNLPRGAYYYRKSLELARESGETYYEVMGLSGLGYSFGWAGESENAINATEEAVALANRAQIPHISGHAHSQLANILMSQGNYSGALKHAAQSLHWAVIQHHASWEVVARMTYGYIYRALEMRDLALEAFWTSMHLMDALGLTVLRPLCSAYFGAIRIHMGDVDDSVLDRLTQAKTDADGGNLIWPFLTSLIALCEYHLGQAQPNAVVGFASEGLKALADHPLFVIWQKPILLIWLGLAQLALGQASAGFATLHEALAYAEMHRFHRATIDAHRALQRAHANVGETKESDRHRVAAEGLIQQIRVNLKDRPDLLGGLHLL